MNYLRKAAQQALEALNLASRNGSDGLKRYEIRELDDTIAELHAALAQPEPLTAYAIKKPQRIRVIKPMKKRKVSNE